VAVVDPVGIGVGTSGASSPSAAPKREPSQPPATNPRMKSESGRRTQRLFHPKAPRIMAFRVRSVVTRGHE
jgi:hypothetical protein